MHVCPHCQQAIAATPALLPAAAIDKSSQLEWHDAARVANVAEAGYLAAYLNERGIAARVVESPSFSAAAGEWNHCYLLQVDAQQVATALEFLRHEAAETEIEADDEERSAESLATFRSLGYVALASIAGFWMGSQSGELVPMRHPAPAERLASEVATAGEPLVARDGRGRPTHRLRYDAPRRALVLDIDTNHDGRLDRPLRFPLDELGVR